jgi:hypothetical protein
MAGACCRPSTARPTRGKLRQVDVLDQRLFDAF